MLPQLLSLSLLRQFVVVFVVVVLAVAVILVNLLLLLLLFFFCFLFVGNLMLLLLFCCCCYCCCCASSICYCRQSRTFFEVVVLQCFFFSLKMHNNLRNCVKSRWPSWAPVPNKPTVSVDVKQHSITTKCIGSFSVLLETKPKMIRLKVKHECHKCGKRQT